MSVGLEAQREDSQHTEIDRCCPWWLCYNSAHSHFKRDSLVVLFASFAGKQDYQNKYFSSIVKKEL